MSDEEYVKKGLCPSCKDVLIPASGCFECRCGWAKCGG